MIGHQMFGIRRPANGVESVIVPLGSVEAERRCRKRPALCVLAGRPEEHVEVLDDRIPLAIERAADSGCRRCACGCSNSPASPASPTALRLVLASRGAPGLGIGA